MRIVSAPKNHFSKLKGIKVKIESDSIPIKEKKLLAIEAAKLVLPIWEVYYKDDRPHLAIQAAEEYINNPTKENKEKVREAANAAADAAADAVVFAANTAATAVASAAFATYVAYSTYYTVYYAIKATKLFFIK